MDPVTELEEGAGPLRLPGQIEVLSIGVHEEAGRQPGRTRKEDQMEAVVLVQPDVGNQPIVGPRQQVGSSAQKVAVTVDLGAFADGPPQVDNEHVKLYFVELHGFF